jgi:hypothetical protein
MDRSLADVWGAFVSAIDALGLDASFRMEGAGDLRWDAVGSIGGVSVVVELKAAPSVGDVLRLDHFDAPPDVYRVLVARRVSGSVRQALADRDMGYFDGRGHLRLWRLPLRIDTDVPVLGEVAVRASQLRLDVPSTLDVALAVLDGCAARGVRATAQVLGRSPGTVSKQLAALRAAYLADEDRQPTVPDLFEAVVDIWHPQRVPLADLPRPGGGPVNDRLQLGFDDVDDPGWVLSDSFAAAAWGAPVVLAGDAPPDFYVPDGGVVRQARTLLGDAEFGRHACTVALAPAPFVCRRRYDRSGVFNDPFLAPSPVVAALDLARDPARGREVLELWTRDLPPEVRRVW